MILRKENVVARVVFGMVIIISLAGCSGQQDEGFLGSGVLEADEIVVSSLLAGRIDSVGVSEGVEVEEGQIIALIDVSKLAAQQQQNLAAQEELAISRRVASRSVEQAEERFTNLQTTLERQVNLLASGSSTQQIVDDLKTQVTLAKSQLSATRDQLDILEAKEKQILAALNLIELQIKDGIITAPIGGSVVEKYIDAGENAAPGTPVAKLIDLEQMWIRIYLDEKDVGLVKLGDPVNLRIDALADIKFAGTVSWISPQAEFTPRNVQTRETRADLVFAVEVTFDNPEHRALIGMPADVYLP